MKEKALLIMYQVGNIFKVIWPKLCKTYTLFEYNRESRQDVSGKHEVGFENTRRWVFAEM